VKILVSLHPFATTNRRPLEMLQAAGHEVLPNRHARRMTEDELVADIAGCAAVICGTEPITARVLAAAPSLKVVSRVGSGYDSVDVAAARAQGTHVAFVPDGPVESVAELTVGMVFDALRGIGRADRSIRAGKWERPMGRLLAGRTVGIAGVSRIGGSVARKLQALGCVILGHDLAPPPGTGIEFVDKQALLARSDILLLHLSLTPQTRHWLGAAEIAQMRDGAIVVNSARGGIIDEDALLAALRAGKLAHAALDVYAQEPYAGPLRELPNVTLTTHIGSMTVEAREKMELDACHHVIEVLAGRLPAHLVGAPRS
jgi:D-3-phosphoglycerate dehydrogenase / 2-oxoglutarate reductase